MTKRDIFSELMEGFDALEQERAGKVTLRKTYRRIPKRLFFLRRLRLILNLRKR